MHYPDNHLFVIPAVPTQRKSGDGRPINQWSIPIPGLPGHYLCSNGNISHSFDYSLTNDGYDWIYPTLQSALDAMTLYDKKATKNSTQFDAHNTKLNDIVHRLLEPQIIPDTFIYWEVLSAENPDFALSKSNSIVPIANRAEFDTFQSALFAKLRYERTHRDLLS